MKDLLISITVLLSLAAGSARAETLKLDVEVENKASHPVPTQQVGTASVSVDNTPTVNVASLPPLTIATPAAETFQAGMHVTVPPGTQSAVGSFVVPAGKRLIIESMAVSGSMPADQSIVTIDTKSGQFIGGHFPSFPIPLVASPFGGSQGTLALKLYADPNTEVTCEVTAAGNTGQLDANCSFSGTMIDVP